jgi:MraZ protein
MFMGQFSHSLDEKGRLIIPSKYREELGREFIVARGYDTCLYAYSNSEWNRFAEEIENLPETSLKNRQKRRFFLSTATNLEMDKQGRVLIPSYLRDPAKISGDVVIAGVGKKLEIWSREIWDSVTNSDEMAAIANEQYDSGEGESRPETEV